MLSNNIEGVSLPLFHRLMSAGYRWRHPGAGLVLLIDRFLQGSPRAKEKVYKFSEDAARNVSAEARKAFIRRLRARIDALRFEDADDPWKTYYFELGSEVDPAAKLSAVEEILRRLKPETVVDLGCNTGVFSLLAARGGAKVAAVDSSEACIEGVYAAACRENVMISPVVSDVVCPTPGGGYMGAQYAPLWDRLRSDVVLCLGLMHHLHINGRQSFERIARLLDATAQKAVIFEFVAMDDANVPRISGRRPIDYDQASVEAALRTVFPRIERVASDRPTRCLFVCER